MKLAEETPVDPQTTHKKAAKLLSYPVLSLSEINCYRYQRFGGVLLPGIRQLKQNFHNEKKLGKILEKAFHKRSVQRQKHVKHEYVFNFISPQRNY